MATKSNNKQERELTMKESIVSMLAIAAVFLLASIDDSKEWHTAEWVRMALGLALGFGTCAWQYKRMHSTDKEA